MQYGTSTLVSIIIPVYNAEETLQRCVHSILNQTEHQWQLILVNDGSIDNSGQICHAFADDDDRILALDKKNGGASSARNLAFQHAKGEWILFVDADDYLSPETLAHHLAYSALGADLVVPDTMIEESNGNRILLHTQEGIIPREMFNMLFSEYHLNHRTSIGGKMFRLDIIQRLSLAFDVQMHHAEDLIFIYKYIQECTRVGFTGFADYHYVFENPESLTQRFNSFQSEFHGLQNIKETIDKTIASLEITESETINLMSWPIINSMSRCLNAIYRTEKNLTARERMKMIRSLDLDFYQEHAPKTKDIKVRFLNFILLDLRWLRLYDSIRIIKSLH